MVLKSLLLFVIFKIKVVDALAFFYEIDALALTIETAAASYMGFS
jgi:hypothetical protein